MKSVVVYSLPPRKPSEANLARLGASCYAVLVVQPDDDRTPPGHVTVPIPEAARCLGISEEAVRGRIKRGTLKSTKVGGRTHAPLNDRPDADSTHAQSTAQSELVAEPRTHVAGLREQLWSKPTSATGRTGASSPHSRNGYRSLRPPDKSRQDHPQRPPSSRGGSAPKRDGRRPSGELRARVVVAAAVRGISSRGPTRPVLSAHRARLPPAAPPSTGVCSD
jgi:hypothetical protein